MRFPLKLVIMCGIICVAALAVLARMAVNPTPAQLCHQAQILIARSEFEAAEQRLQRALQIQPDYAYAHFQTARLCLQQRRYADALTGYHTALKLDPLLFLSIDFQGFLTDAAEFDKADGFLRSYARLARELPANAVGAAHVAALDLAGRLEHRRFLYECRQLAAELGTLAVAADDLILHEVSAGRLDEATEMLRRNLPKDDDAGRLLAKVQSVREISVRASRYLEEALAADIDFIASRLGKAAIDIQLGARERGLETVLDVMAQLDHPPAGLRLYAAQMLAREARIEEAEVLVDRVLIDDPKNITARHLKAGIMFCTDDYARLVPAVKDLLEKNPREERAIFLQGSIDLLAGRHHLALKNLGMLSDPNWELLGYHRALAEYRTGHLNAAELALRRLCTWRSGFAEAHLARAAVALTADRTDTAVEICRGVLERNPGDPDALRMLAAGHVASGRSDAAIDAMEKYLELRPDSAQAIQALAAARMANGEIRRVIDDHEYLAAQPDASKAHHRVLAFAYSLAGQMDRAEQHYDKLVQYDAASPEPELFRARRLALDGRINAAIAQCRAGLARGASASALMATLGSLNTMAGRHSDADEQLAVATDMPVETTFIANVYFALVHEKDYSEVAAQMLAADPFSRRSQDLLLMAHSSGLRGPDLRGSLAAIVQRQPGTVGLLNSAVVLRRQNAASLARLQMIELDSLWPRLLHVYRTHGLDWP